MPARAYDDRVLPAIVLAAGASRRMGKPKATLPLPGGETFLSRVVRTLRDAGVAEIVVVVRDAAIASQALPAYGSPVRVILNPDPDRGQLSSLLLGLDAADGQDTDAVLVTLVDVPTVSAATVRAIVAAWHRTHAPVVRPVSGTRHGHPVIFGREAFEKLRGADLSEGAKPVVRAFGARMCEVRVDDAGAFEDADTPDEYERLVRILKAERP